MRISPPLASHYHPACVPDIARNRAVAQLRGAWFGACLLAALVTPALAQTPSANLLVNGGFENNPPPSLCANNLGASVTPWQLAGGGRTNVIAVDGGTTVDPALGRTGGGTCNYGINVNFDAEVANPNGTRRHYLDIDGVNELYQTLVVPSCGSGDTRPRTLRFSGYFSSRDTGTGGSGTVRLLRGNIQVDGSRVQPVAGEGVLLASVSSPPALPWNRWTQVSGTATVVPGDKITYAIYMSNPTNFDNASITVDDLDCPATTLTLKKHWAGATVGNTATLTATRVAGTPAVRTQIDSLSSTATAAANAPGGQTTTDATPTTVFAGDVIELAETFTPATATYHAGLQCTGDVGLSGFTLTVGALGAGAAPIVCTFSNSLSAQPSLVVGKDIAGVADTNDNGVTGDAGDLVTYAFTVRNNGNVALTGVSLTDPLAGLSALAITWPDPANPGTLPVNTEATATATYTLTPADAASGQMSNTVTATANPVGGVTPRGSDSITQPVLPTPAPQLTLAKTAAVADTNGNGSQGDAGDVVTYTLTATNAGNVPLSGVVLTDPLAGLSTLTITWPDAANPGTLPVGAQATATATYTLSVTDATAGQVSNTASVTADPVNGKVAVPPATATASQPVLPTPAPQLTLAKTAAVADTNGNGTQGDAGDVVTYTLTATNAGNVPLSGVVLTDPLAGLSTLTITWPDAANPGTLPVGAQATATATYTLSAADVTAGQVSNTATATADPVNGLVAVPPATGTASVSTRAAPQGVTAVPVNHPLARWLLVGAVAWLGRRAWAGRK